MMDTDDEEEIDIVECLRQSAEICVRKDGDDPMPELSNMLHEAADEIGRLRAQIAAWEMHARHHGCVPDLKFNS